MALTTFLPSVRNEFTGWDDGAYITTNPNMEGLSGLFRIWTSTQSDQYYPLTFTGYWIEYQLWGRSPYGYHAVNVAMHAINAWLLLLLLRGLGMKRWPACACALLFAVHPVQVMSAAWIPGRKNLQSGLFVLISALTWIRFRRDGRDRWYVVSLLAFAAGLLSKSAVLTLPIVLAAVDRITLEVSWRKVVVRIAPILALAAVSAGVTVLFEKKFIFEPPKLPARALIASAAVWFYALKLLLPLNLAPIYALWDVSARQLAWYPPFIALILAAALLWRIRRRYPAVALGAITFVGFSLPSLGLVPFGNMAVTYVSDHYLYLALIGPFAVAMAGLQRIRKSFRRESLTTAALAVVVAILALASMKYSNAFRDALSMWTYTLERNPDCYPAHAGLGYHYAGRGEWNRAVNHYRKAAQIMPQLSEAHVALGNAMVRADDIADAGRAYDRALHLDTDNTGAMYGLAVVAQRRGDAIRAIEFYEQTLRADPDHCRARLGLAALRLQRGDLATAAQQCERALEICPGEPRAYLGLAACRRRQHLFSEAIDVLRAGLRVAPDDIRLLNFLARILATSPDETVRNGQDAVRFAERACALSSFRNHDCMDTLAAAYAESGRFADAERVALQAADLARAAGAVAAAQAMRGRASQYARGEPLREVAVGEIPP